MRGAALPLFIRVDSTFIRAEHVTWMRWLPDQGKLELHFIGGGAPALLDEHEAQAFTQFIEPHGAALKVAKPEPVPEPQLKRKPAASRRPTAAGGVR